MEEEQVEMWTHTHGNGSTPSTGGWTSRVRAPPTVAWWGPLPGLWLASHRVLTSGKEQGLSRVIFF